MERDDIYNKNLLCVLVRAIKSMVQRLGLLILADKRLTQLWVTPFMIV